MTEQTKPSSVPIPCFVLPMHEMQLILPNVAVAEVISWEPIMAVVDVPNWYLGHLEWRGEQVPILSFERLNDSEMGGHSDKARIVIFNGSGQFQDLDFFGMIIQSMPRMMRVENEVITELVDVEKVPSVQMVVNSPQGTSIIPDLSYIEKCVHEVRGSL